MDQALSTRIAGFLGGDAGERRAICDAIAEASGGTLDVVRVDRAGVFLHRPSNVLFHLVPGGTFEMGFATAERDRLREQYQFWDDCDEVEYAFSRIDLGCTREVRVTPFL